MQANLLVPEINYSSRSFRACITKDSSSFDIGSHGILYNMYCIRLSAHWSQLHWALFGHCLRDGLYTAMALLFVGLCHCLSVGLLAVHADAKGVPGLRPANQQQQTCEAARGLTYKSPRHSAPHKGAECVQ